MLGDLPGVEARLVGGLRDLQLVLEDLGGRTLGPFDPVEDAEFERALGKRVVRHGWGFYMGGRLRRSYTSIPR